MDLKEAMLVRHSVRSFLDKRIEGEEKEKLEAFIRTCNSESGLHMQLLTDEPEAFSSLMAHYGSFRNVRNYIAVAGRDTPDLDEKCGYFGSVTSYCGKTELTEQLHLTMLQPNIV